MEEGFFEIHSEVHNNLGTHVNNQVKLVKPKAIRATTHNDFESVIHSGSSGSSPLKKSSLEDLNVYHQASESSGSSGSSGSEEISEEDDRKQVFNLPSGLKRSFHHYFTEHPRQTHQTYWEHLSDAIYYSWRSLLACTSFLIHGLFPNIYQNTGNYIIYKIYMDEMELRQICDDQKLD